MSTITTTINKPRGTATNEIDIIRRLQVPNDAHTRDNAFQRLHSTASASRAYVTQPEKSPSLTNPHSPSSEPVSGVEAAKSPPPPRTFDVSPSNAIGRTRKILLTALIISANLVQTISNNITIAAGLSIAPDLGIPAEPSQANWIAAAYSLTQGTFVLISGRLGSVYGHKRMLMIGGAWFAICSMANGFCETYITFTIVRALTGIGGAILMPNAVAMLSIAVPPGRMRNLSVAFFAASAPIGGWLGALFPAIITPWKWVFWFMAMLAAAVVGLLAFLLPKESPVDRDGKIDYIGAGLGVSGLILFNFAWNQAPSAGWSTPYEIGLLITSIALFALFVVWENHFAKEPIMPLSIFKAPSFSALIVVVLLSYMSFSISLWYMISWNQLLRGWSLIDTAIYWIPFGIGATASAILAAWLIPRVPAQWIVAIGAGTAGVSNLLLATMPEQQTYWAQVFPAIVIGSFCPDLVYTSAQIIACNSVNRRQQGVAASLIGTLNLYGISLGLGFAGTIETQVNRGQEKGNHLLGFRAALYFGVGIAAVAAVLDAWLVRMPRDEREGWVDENDNDPADGVLMSSSVAVGPERKTREGMTQRVG